MPNKIRKSCAWLRFSKYAEFIRNLQFYTDEIVVSVQLQNRDLWTRIVYGSNFLRREVAFAHKSFCATICAICAKNY